MIEKFSHLKQQLNKDDKGASLVTVLLVASIVTMIMTVLVAVVILNIYMKKADKLGQQTFYDAESAMEEIRVGLSQEVSKQASDAYIETLTNYDQLTDEEKTDHFEQLFAKELSKTLAINEESSTGAKYYNIDKLTSYLNETAYDSDKKIGAKIVTVKPNNAINIEKDDGIVLKNVAVTYRDRDGYTTQIQTDICLEYPPISFENTSPMDNILTYGIICSDNFKAESNTSIEGSAFLGNDSCTISTTGKETSACNFLSSDNSVSNILTGANMDITRGSYVKGKGVALWADSLNIDSGSTFKVDEESSTFLKNDLVVNGGMASLSGKLIMFGNPWKVESARFIKDHQDNADKIALQQNMADYSSSILITGPNSGVDLTGLTTMVIGGSSYVNTNKSNKSEKLYQDNYRVVADDYKTVIESYGSKQGDKLDDRTTKNKYKNPKHQEEVVMGQSIALKSDQRAYLVPGAVVGMGYNNGGHNPMTYEQWNNLLTEIANDGNKNYGGDINKVSQQDVVDFNATIPNYGIALNSFPFEVDSYKVRCYKDSFGRSMVYLFMQFNTTGVDQTEGYIPAEAKANYWYGLYNSSGTNNQNLASNVYYYATRGIKLPKTLLNKGKINASSMYFTGDIIGFGNDDPKMNTILESVITQSDIFNQDLNAEYSAQSIYYQEVYYALKKMMTTKYEAVENAGVNDDGIKPINYDSKLFTNIVRIESKKLDNDTTYYGLKTLDKASNYYVSVDGEAAYVKYFGNAVGSHDVKISEISKQTILMNQEDRDGNRHGADTKLYLVITDGNVIIDQDFEGVIIAGGDVTLKTGKKVTSNAEKAARALLSSKMVSDGQGGKDEVFVKDCIYNAEHYLVGGLGTSTKHKDKYALSEFITYRNWKKQ